MRRLCEALKDHYDLGEETGDCPHTAINDLQSRHLELILVESGGDKILRKGGPGITKSDLLILNQINSAEQVHAFPDVMDRDSKNMRG